MQTSTMMFGTFALLAASVAGFAAGRTIPQDAPMTELGKEHQWLASHAGEYSAQVGGMFGEADGSSRIESALGGLWSIKHFESTMMGQPYQGIEILGFDPLREKFVSVWVDSMTPLLMTMEGTYDEGTKTLTMRGESTGMDGERAEMVNTTEFGAEGTVFTMNIEGEPAPLMIIKSARKK